MSICRVCTDSPKYGLLDGFHCLGFLTTTWPQQLSSSIFWVLHIYIYIFSCDKPMIPVHCHKCSLTSLTAPQSVLRALNQFQNEGYSKWQPGLFTSSTSYILKKNSKKKKNPPPNNCSFHTFYLLYKLVIFTH